MSKHVSRPYAVASVAIQGRVRVRVHEKIDDRAAKALKSPSGRPVLCLEDVETDLSSLEVNVGVEDLSQKPDLGRTYRVVLLNVEAKFEPPLAVWSVRRAANVALPVEEVVVHWLEQNVLVARARELEELLVQSISRDHIIIDLKY